MSTYYPQIPQASDSPASSQPQILSNFGGLNDAFGVDHVTYAPEGVPAAPTAQTGQHVQVTFTAPLASAPALPVPQSAVLYTKTAAGAEQLFFTNTEGSTYQITNTSGSSLVPLAYGRFYKSGTTYSLRSGSVNVTSVNRNTGTFGSTAYIRATVTLTSAVSSTNARFLYDLSLINQGNATPIIATWGWVGGTSFNIFFWALDGTASDSNLSDVTFLIW